MFVYDWIKFLSNLRSDVQVAEIGLWENLCREIVCQFCSTFPPWYMDFFNEGPWEGWEKYLTKQYTYKVHVKLPLEFFRKDVIFYYLNEAVFYWFLSIDFIRSHDESKGYCFRGSVPVFFPTLHSEDWSPVRKKWNVKCYQRCKSWKSTLSYKSQSGALL